MKTTKRFAACGLLAWACISALALSLAGHGNAPAQETETTRKLWDTAFIDHPRKPGARRRAAAPRRYTVVAAAGSLAEVSGDTVLGVTIWRLRPSRPADAGERLLVHEASGAVAWLPERVSSDNRFAEGDRLRLSFEAARVGYLYVIDREQYADGRRGEPYLIFPTLRTRGGNNEVKRGRLLEIPAQDDEPPYLTLRRSRTDQVSENLTVLVSPTPIAGLQITEKAQRLSLETVAAWEKSWGGQTGRLEMTDGAGRPWSSVEKAAAADRAQSLTAAEPAPQTIYYRPGATSAAPTLINVQLQYARRQARADGRR
jgi:hypothetical protein